jgi:peptidoglycan-N-acetylmuramic acid deacetylase
MKLKPLAALALAALLLMQAGCASRQETFSSEASSEYSSGESSGESADEPSSIPDEPEESDSEESEPEEKPALAMSADFLSLADLSDDLVTWGPGVQLNDENRPIACVSLQEQYGDYDAYFIAPSEDKTVTLTFDQGYENGYTSAILDTLKEKNVTAVFFLTGHYLRSQPELVQRIIDEGHVVGSHSDSHKVYCSELTIEESYQDALGMQEALRTDYNYEMRLFRFPEGQFSEQSLALMQSMGYKSLFWSFAYADWDTSNQPTKEAAMERILQYLHPGEIMLLHSVSSTNAAILGDLIDEIRARGYEIGPFAAIS